MKRLPIERAVAVESDVFEVMVWIAKDSVSTAERFNIAVDATVDDLAEMPGMGALFELGELDFRGLRKKSVRGFPNHLIFYRKQGGVLKVIRVLHGAQELLAQLEGEWK